MSILAEAGSHEDPWDQLHESTARLAELDDARATALQRRRQAMNALVSSGVLQAAIAAQVGITPSRVTQILKCPRPAEGGFR